MNTGTWDSFYIEDSSTTYLDGVSFPNGLVVSFTVLPSLGGLLIPPEQTMFLGQKADFSSLDVSLMSSPPQILYQLDTYYLTRSSDWSLHCRHYQRGLCERCPTDRWQLQRHCGRRSTERERIADFRVANYQQHDKVASVRRGHHEARHTSIEQQQTDRCRV
jgi:hypothetical protein